MAKFCGNCGTQLEDNAKICGKCGTPLDGVCKSQYKNAGFGQNKNVGFPTFLFCLFNHHQSLAEADLLICRKDH